MTDDNDKPGPSESASRPAAQADIKWDLFIGIWNWIAAAHVTVCESAKGIAEDVDRRLAEELLAVFPIGPGYDIGN